MQAMPRCVERTRGSILRRSRSVGWLAELASSLYERTNWRFTAANNATMALHRSCTCDQIEIAKSAGAHPSMGVHAPVPNFGACVASKCALDAFGDVLAAENHHRGLTVSSVYHPLVRTQMSAVLNLLARTDPVGDQPTEFPAQRAILDRLGRSTPF